MAAAVKDTFNNVMDKLHLSNAETSAPPQEPSAEELSSLQDRYRQAKQDQVFAFYESLSTSDKAVLYDQLASIDPEYINNITEQALHPPAASKEDKEPTVEPLPENARASILDSDAASLEGWYSSGLELIAQNKVAVVLMAGGQGTRLGSSAPKGCFNIGLPSEKSLFQLQAERIYRVQQLARNKHGKEKGVVPWYVMTSGPTRGPTEKYFEEHKYFGLEKENVVIFEQGVLPCISNDGKILLESKSKVILIPYVSVSGRIANPGAGRSCSGWKWRHLPGPGHVGSSFGHAQTRDPAHPRLLCRQLPCQGGRSSLHWFRGRQRRRYRYQGGAQAQRQ